jgi:hypothetical protein
MSDGGGGGAYQFSETGKPARHIEYAGINPVISN